MTTSRITGRVIEVVAEVGIGAVAGACARADLLDELGAKIGEALVAGDRVSYTVEVITGEWVTVTFAHQDTADFIRDAIRAAVAKWGCTPMLRSHSFLFGAPRCVCGKLEAR